MRHGVLLCCSLLIGCSSSAVLQSARSDDPATFRDRLPALLAREELELSDAQDVALAIMRRDITGGRGRADLSGLHELRECALSLDQELADRAKLTDEVAALACMVRIDAGLVAAQRYAPYVTHRDAGWRAVGARGLVEAEPARADAGDEAARRLAEHGRWRRKLMADPSALVRRAALSAAAEAQDPRDAAALLEAARLDPAPEIRVLAIEAASHQVGQRNVALALSDLWTRGSDDERSALTKAWARLAASVPEARARLVRAAQTDQGRSSVVAALALLEGQQPDEARADVVAAAAALARHIDSGAPPARVAAIDDAPFSWPTLGQAVVAAAEDSDPEVAVAAQARLLDQSDRRQATLKTLRELATVPGRAGARAKQVLAHAGDASVVPLLERDAGAKSAVQRSAAGQQLARLGKLKSAVRLLGDSDARVRAAVACAIVRLDSDP